MTDSSAGKEINDVLKEAQRYRDSSEVSAVMLEMLAVALKCEVAIYWVIDSNIRKLRERQSWYSSNIATEKLKSDSSKRTFQRGEGMPGKSWKFGRVFLSNDLQMDMCLPRSKDAHVTGLRSGIWLPFTTEGKVFGVFELLSRDQITALHELTGILEKFVSEASKLLC